ncbi:hypothetical protein ColTof4_01446 [Colletotrichum tofieldiae]|nr:hypothetical protein ColTof4_01446 [Colletotrichum tofieldiae]GKT96891.1 hypothetical protein Ct61P_14741 [Colletotrichum tofieldiae]
MKIAEEKFALPASIADESPQLLVDIISVGPLPDALAYADLDMTSCGDVCYWSLEDQHFATSRKGRMLRTIGPQDQLVL